MIKDLGKEPYQHAMSNPHQQNAAKLQTEPQDGQEKVEAIARYIDISINKLNKAVGAAIFQSVEFSYSQLFACRVMAWMAKHLYLWGIESDGLHLPGINFNLTGFYQCTSNIRIMWYLHGYCYVMF